MEKAITESFKINSNRISHICYELLESINLTLNQEWFYKAIDGLPIRMENLQNILELLSTNIYFDLDYNKIGEAGNSLKNLLYSIKNFLVPVIREKLGISYLSGNIPDKKSREFIYYSFIAYTFPFNLQKIENLLIELGNMLSTIKISGKSW